MVDIKKPASNISHSFIVRPQVEFESQHTNEEVVLVVRKHPVTQLTWIINSILLVIVGFILSAFIFPQFLVPNLNFVFIVFLLIFTFSYFWLNFLFWYFHNQVNRLHFEKNG